MTLHAQALAVNAVVAASAPHASPKLAEQVEFSLRLLNLAHTMLGHAGTCVTEALEVLPYAAEIDLQSAAHAQVGQSVGAARMSCREVHQLAQLAPAPEAAMFVPQDHARWFRAFWTVRNALGAREPAPEIRVGSVTGLAAAQLVVVATRLGSAFYQLSVDLHESGELHAIPDLVRRLEALTLRTRRARLEAGDALHWAMEQRAVSDLLAQQSLLSD